METAKTDNKPLPIEEQNLFGYEAEALEIPEHKQYGKSRNRNRISALCEIEESAECRRAYGVAELLRITRMQKPRAGKSLHILTGGNIDLLSHIWWMFYHYERLTYVFMSCWSINGNDLLMLERWIAGGKIGKVDLVVGEIYRKKFWVEWGKIEEMQAAGLIGQVYESEIHSKFIAAETSTGEKIVVESSANCNANRLVENNIITVSGELFDFYISYFRELFEIERVRTTNRKIEGTVILDGVDDE